MKKIVLFAIGVLFAGSVFAQNAPILQQQQSILGQMKSLSDEYKALDQSNVQLNKRWEDLKWGKQQFDKQVQTYKAAQDQETAAEQQYEAAAADHNRRCAGTFSDHNYVAACNAEMAQGQARKQQLLQNRQNLENTRQQLIELQRVTTEETQKVFSQYKQNTARMDQIRAQFNVLKNQLAQIQTQVDRCNKAIAQGSKENMHDVCGAMFDGNK